MAKTPAQRTAKHGGSATPAPPVVVNKSTKRTPAQAQGNANMLLIAAAVASLFLFWYVHLLTLNQMTDLSGGLAMPDSMVFGFNPAQIEALRAAMDADANGQLQFIHKTAGTLFPLVFGITAITLIAANVPGKTLRRLLWVLPVLFAATRIFANFAIDDLLAAEALSDGAVAGASALVASSWALLVLSLAAIGYALFVGRRRKVPAASAS